jgi:heme/copper-type cytochrome/quinol oxidase subunit 3
MQRLRGIEGRFAARFFDQIPGLEVHMKAQHAKRKEQERLSAAQYSHSDSDAGTNLFLFHACSLFCPLQTTRTTQTACQASVNSAPACYVKTILTMTTLSVVSSFKIQTQVSI